MVDAVAAGQNVVPPSENINAALESILAGEGSVIVTGSVHTVGDALEMIWPLVAEEYETVWDSKPT